MKQFLLKAGRYAIAHKAVSAVVILAVAFGSYYAHQRSAASQTTTKYILATAKKGSLVSSVTGSGQISALDQVDIASQVSGTISSVLVQAGDSVKKGDVIATLDDRDALNTVSTTELTIASDEIALQKAIKQSATQATSSSSSDLKKAYQAGYDAVASAFIDFPTIFQDVGDILYTPSHSPYFSDTQIALNVDSAARSYKDQAGVLFDRAKKDYEAQYQAYKSITADSDPATLIDFLNTTYGILKDLSSALTGTYSTIDYIGAHMSGPTPAQLGTDKTTVSGYLTKVNSNMTAISNAVTAISAGEDTSISADLDVKSAELALKQANAALQDAQDALAYHTIRAPFDGIIAKVPTTVEYGNTLGNNATVATIITKAMRATMTLNEIDTAKIKVGQKAELSFDAIDGLTVPGTVSEIDVVGTVNSGVVSYGVTISLDSTDDRIKPGMTTNVSIAAGSRDNVIIVPTTAVSAKGGSSYVMVSTDGTAAPGSLKAVKVETGLSNDSMTEITSGLNEGDTYVARTVVTTALKTTTAGSLFGGAGGVRATGTGGGNRAGFGG